MTVNICINKNWSLIYLVYSYLHHYFGILNLLKFDHDNSFKFMYMIMLFHSRSCTWSCYFILFMIAPVISLYLIHTLFMVNEILFGSWTYLVFHGISPHVISLYFIQTLFMVIHGFWNLIVPFNAPGISWYFMVKIMNVSWNFMILIHEIFMKFT